MKKIFFIIALIVALQGVFVTSINAQNKGMDADVQKFGSALNIINMFYVDTERTSKLTEYAIIGMLKELDPHSVYLTKEELKEANEPLQGNFDGIGVQFNILNDTIYVIAATAGGPSDKVGIISGDKIVKVDGDDATGSKITTNWVLKKLRGVKGTKVIVGIARKGEKNVLDFTITRDKIPIYSIVSSYMATPDIGYIKLDRFASTTMDEFKQGLTKLKKNGAKSLILDLRGNSGGYLETAIKLADEFLDANKTIVYTEGVSSPINRSNSTSIGDFEKGKLVVLIDEGSASASEILAGAVQDWDRGLIIGRRSFGKGLVQRPYYLPDGSAIRLTTARYHTPTGRWIQKSYKEGADKYYKDLTTRYEKGEFYNQDSIKFPDSLKYYTPNKRLVYGGGGIMPDIFIPLDTSQNSKYLTECYRKGIFNQYCLEYIDKNRKDLQAKYPKFEDYKINFKIDNAFLEDFIKYAEKKELKRNDKEIANSLKTIQATLKGFIARDLWDMNEFYQCLTDLDIQYNKAISVIQDNSFRKMKVQSW